MKINWQGIIGWIIIAAITYGIWNFIISAPLWVFFGYIIGTALIMVCLYEDGKGYDDDG